MKFLLKMLATAALTVGFTDAKDGHRFSTLCGGPHGDYFISKVDAGEIVKEVTLYGAERVDGIRFITRSVGSTTDSSFMIGSEGGDPVQIRLEPGEHIKSIECHSDKHNQHTRVFFLGLTTNKNNTISVGTRSGEAGFDEAPFEYQLSGFHGFHGREVDMAGAIWTSIEVNPRIVAVIVP